MLLEYLEPTVDIIEFLANGPLASERSAKDTRDGDGANTGGGFTSTEEGDEEGW